MNHTQKNAVLISVTLVVIAIVVSGIKFTPKERKETILDYFDTVTEITVVSKHTKPINDCKKYMQKMDFELSADNENALVFRYNNGENVKFSEDSNKLIKFAKNFTEENPDYFSVYLDPIIKAWDVKNYSGVIPQVDSALEKSMKKDTLNLGGVAKGFVTEQLVEILKKDNVSSALINLGGNTFALGKKPTGEFWRIGIQNPKDEDGIIGIISAENLAVITSGDYQRYFELNGVRYHHILNPKNGHPANNGLHSVTVISENPTLCDALSTAAFVAGLEKGTELLKKYDCMGIFITDDTVYFSKELESIFKQTDFSYKYEFIY